MPRGGVFVVQGLVFSCPRIRDYVNPWWVLGCEHGDAGVFVITDSWSWFRAGGFQTREHKNRTPATGSLHR